jgi:pimeloyl-ACP methyl ester carboxylesterase
MARAYEEELVATQAEDGVPLDGVVIRPSGAQTRPLPIIWVHGNTGRFYERHALEIGRDLASRGFVVVSGNNRGHDWGGVVTLPDGERKWIGAGWELFDEAPRDVAAWVDFTAGLGFDSVVLVGHSRGSFKVTQYQAERQDRRVAGVAIASASTRAAALDPTLAADARRMVAEGRGRDLMPWGSTRVGGTTASAESIATIARVNIDFFGFHTPNPAIGRITCPILALYGHEEPEVGTAADLETIRRNARASSRVETRMVGGNHVYRGHEHEVAAVLADWVGSLAS